MKKSRISQQQIARDLGVSQTLVSMVLNGRRKGVSEKSCQRILDHARNQGYRPKGLAAEFLSAPPLKRSVGLILREGATLYNQSSSFGHVQHGLLEYLGEEGGNLVFMGDEQDLDSKRFQSLQSPDAFVGLVVMGQVKRPFLQDLLKRHSKVVSVGCQYPGLCDSIVPNEEQAADLLVQHLMDLGHKRFAWIGGNRGTQRCASRLRAVQSALLSRGASLDSKFCFEAEAGNRPDGSQMADSLLEATDRDELPTAWICFNGIMARGAIDQLTASGLSVPGDVSVCAFDATHVCEDESPKLTAASTSPERMGRVAAERLLQSKEEDEASYVDYVLPAELHVRESAGPVAGNDLGAVRKFRSKMSNGVALTV